MKHKLILSFLLIMTFTSLKATNWFPIGAKWHWALVEDCCGPLPRPELPFQWNVIKDTVIQGKNCMVIEKSGEHSIYEQQYTYRYIYNNDNGKITRFIDDKFLPTYDFTKNVGDTSLIVTDSGNNSCDTFLFIIDSIKPLLQDNSLKVQYGKLVTNSTCASPSEQIDYLTIVEKVGLSQLYTKLYYFITDGGHEYIRCYNDAVSDFHFVNFACDSVIDKVVEKLNTNLPIKIFPNPSKDKIQIEFKENTKYKNTEIVFYDVTGKIIKTALKDKSQDFIEINLTDLQNGLYFLKIITDNEFITKQIIINH